MGTVHWWRPFDNLRMRIAVLYALVACFVPVAILRPKWGLLGYIFFSLCRPDIIAYAPTSGLSMVLAFATLIGSAARVKEWILQFRNPFVILLILELVGVIDIFKKT